MIIRAAIFDLDYTLIDASDAIFLCIIHALDTLGHALPTREVAVATIGLSLKETYKMLTRDTSTENATTFQNLFVKYAQDEKKQYLDNTRLFPTALPSLQLLREVNCKIALVTTKTRDCVDDILQKFDLNQYFDYIIGGNEVDFPKPHPMSIQLAMRALGIPANETIYVGDSIIDAEAANRAGVAFIAVLTGQTQRQAFANYVCHSVHDDLSQFSAIVATYPGIVAPLQEERPVAEVSEMRFSR